MTMNRITDESLNQLIAIESLASDNASDNNRLADQIYHANVMAGLEELKERREAELNAEPVGSFHISNQHVEATSDYVKNGEWPIDNGELLVYAIPQVGAKLPKKIPPCVYQVIFEQCDGFVDVGADPQKIWKACCAAILKGGAK